MNGNTWFESGNVSVTMNNVLYSTSDGSLAETTAGGELLAATTGTDGLGDYEKVTPAVGAAFARGPAVPPAHTA